MRKLNDRQDELWAFLPSDAKPNTKLAIFVHGFIGNYLDTWGALPDLLAENADANPPFDEWDYLFIGYDTANPNTYLDIASLICTKWDDAASGLLPKQRKYDKLALLGHSLGTLGIRQVLCAWSLQPEGMRKALQSVTLFGTPLNGSGLAKWGKLRYRIAEALERNSPQLFMLREWLKSAFSMDQWPLARVVLGLDDQVVGYDYRYLIDFPGDRKYTQTNFDHRQLVKPTGFDKSSVVDYVRAALT